MQLERYGRSTLTGLKRIRPVVSVVTDEETKLAFISKDSLQTMVELELRKVGIEVVEDPNERHEGIFGVMFNVHKSPIGSYYDVIHLASLRQIVQLARDPKIRTEAATWPLLIEPRGDGIGGLNLEKSMKEFAADLTKEFINDYLAANPKEPVKKEGLSLKDMAERAKPKEEQDK